MAQVCHIGAGCLHHIQEIVATHGSARIFFVVGQQSFVASGAKQILSAYCKALEYCIFDNFSKNPKLEDVIRGVNVISHFQADLVVAVGGGSALDMAKLINVFHAQKNASYMDIIQGRAKILNKPLPLVAVPTTAGSGSESTHFAVVYVDNKKYSVADELMLPNYAIVDAELSASMSAQLTAITGMDALCQAIESYWSVGATDESKAYAAQAITLIKGFLVKAVREGNAESRSKMAYAANLAGKAINISKTTAPHALSYALTSYFGIPHGHAVALTLPNFFMINATLDNVEINDPRGKEYVLDTMNNLYEMLGCKSAQEAAHWIRQTMHQIDLPVSLCALDIEPMIAMDKVAANLNYERLKNNPVVITPEIIGNIFSEFDNF
ncbi:MAG: phosphonoacetaldehyde reductase [Gammaproteobacteria bacterium]